MEFFLNRPNWRALVAADGMPVRGGAQ